MINEQEIKIQVGELLALLHPIDWETVIPDDELHDELVHQIKIVSELIK